MMMQENTPANFYNQFGQFLPIEKTSKVKNEKKGISYMDFQSQSKCNYHSKKH